MNNAMPPRGLGWRRRLTRLLYEHLVLPFLQTYDPVHRVALGASVGVFLGLTPTVGVQMYSVTMLWVVCRLLFRVRFNMTIGWAMVWISNPVTMVPLYYVFLITGHLFQDWMGHEVIPIAYEAFSVELNRLAAGEHLEWWQWLLNAAQVLVVEFGWPMVLGSLVYAVPGSLLTYPVTALLVRKYRVRLAESQGLTYEQWRRRFEVRD